MTYTTDISNLETYKSGGPLLEANADTNVFLYKVFLELANILADTSSIDTTVSTLNADKATATGQSTIIARLTTLLIDTAQLDIPLSTLETSLDAIITELSTGLMKVAVDNILTELADGNVKINLDTIITDLSAVTADVDNLTTDTATQLANILTELQNQNTNNGDLVGLDPSLGLNDSLYQAVIDIRNNTSGGTTSSSGGTNSIVLTDQLLVGTPSVRNITLTSANTEYSVVLPPSTRRFSIKSRLDTGDPSGLIRYAYVTGIVATPTIIGDDAFYTVGDYVEDVEDSVHLTQGLTIYFASDTPGVVVTVKYWEAATSTASVPPGAVFVRNLFLVTPDTEYIYEFPADVKRYSIKVRGDAGDNTGIVRTAYTAGVVATGSPVGNESYVALHSDAEIQENALAFSSTFRVYMASSTANVAVTIEYWT